MPEPVSGTLPCGCSWASADDGDLWMPCAVARENGWLHCAEFEHKPITNVDVLHAYVRLRCAGFTAFQAREAVFEALQFVNIEAASIFHE